MYYLHDHVATHGQARQREARRHHIEHGARHPDDRPLRREVGDRLSASSASASI